MRINRPTTCPISFGKFKKGLVIPASANSRREEPGNSQEIAKKSLDYIINKYGRA